MKKLSLSLISCGIIAVCLGGNAMAADGTITFTGSLTADACTVDAGSQNMSVDMGEVATTAFSGGPGTKSSPTKFDIQLTACPDTVTGAAVKFDGETDPTNPNLLKLDSDAVATGVGIEISDNSGTPIALHTASTVYPLQEGDNTLSFVSRYVSTDAQPGAGATKATSLFTLNYQ